MTSDVKMQNYLADVTDALLAGQETDTIRRRYSINTHDHEEFLDLVDQVDTILFRVEPSHAYKRHLRADLLNEPKPIAFWQMRGLPARVQLAAIATLLSSFVMFWRRRIFGTPVPDTEKKQKEEIHVLH